MSLMRLSGGDIMSDEVKYRGKNAAQINYLKQMEDIDRK